MAKHGSHLLCHILYCVILLITGVALVIAVALPSWFSSSASSASCGIFSYCDSDKPDSLCQSTVAPYGTTVQDAFPTDNVRNVGALFLVAIVITWLCFLVSLMTCCFCYSCTSYQAPALSLSSIFVLIAIIMISYAVGDFSNSNFTADPERFRCDCGTNVKPFNSGDCTYQYGLYISCISLFLTLVAGYVSYKVKGLDIEHGLYE